MIIKKTKSRVKKGTTKTEFCMVTGPRRQEFLHTSYPSGTRTENGIMKLGASLPDLGDAQDAASLQLLR